MTVQNNHPTVDLESRQSVFGRFYVYGMTKLKLIL
jgi:hypothetical protein